MLTKDDLTTWILKEISSRTGNPPDKSLLKKSFLECGLDSLDAYELIGELEDRVKTKVSLEKLKQLKNIQQLIDFISR